MFLWLNIIIYIRIGKNVIIVVQNNKSKNKRKWRRWDRYKKEQPLICLLFWTTTWTTPTKTKTMSSDQRWRLLRPAFSIFFLFFLPHNLTFGLCFSTDGTYFCFIFSLLSLFNSWLMDQLWVLAALALMKFKERIERDPFGALMNWGELSHCSWSGVVCSHDGRVVIL